MGNVIAETAGGGATGTTGTTREYIYLYETEIAPTMGSRTVVDRPLSVVDAVNTASPVLYNVSVDHLNRPVLMTNTAKSPVWTAIWQPWGGVHSITGSATLNTRFPGQWYQTETGLHYNWHRSYDPTLGRYTQPDPLGFVDGPSVYAYVRGAPLSLLDPKGLDAGGGGGGGGGGGLTPNKCKLMFQMRLYTKRFDFLPGPVQVNWCVYDCSNVCPRPNNSIFSRIQKVYNPPYDCQEFTDRQPGE